MRVPEPSEFFAILVIILGVGARRTGGGHMPAITRLAGRRGDG